MTWNNRESPRKIDSIYETSVTLVMKHMVVSKSDMPDAKFSASRQNESKECSMDFPSFPEQEPECCIRQHTHVAMRRE